MLPEKCRCAAIGESGAGRIEMLAAGPGEGAMHLFSASEIASFFKELPEAVTNTLEVANRCNLVLEKTKVGVPRFDIPGGMTSEAYLEKLRTEVQTRALPDNRQA